MTGIALPDMLIRPAGLRRSGAGAGVVVVGVEFSRLRVYPRFFGAPARSYRECKSGYRQQHARMLGRSQTLAGA